MTEVLLKIGFGIISSQQEIFALSWITKCWPRYTGILVPSIWLTARALLTAWSRLFLPATQVIPTISGTFPFFWAILWATTMARISWSPPWVSMTTLVMGLWTGSHLFHPRIFIAFSLKMKYKYGIRFQLEINSKTMPSWDQLMRLQNMWHIGTDDIIVVLIGIKPFRCSVQF